MSRATIMSTQPGQDASGGIRKEDPQEDRTLEQVRDALRGLQYGVVSIIVQDGVVIQIERTEKTRLRRMMK